MARVRSLQARLSSALAMLLCGGIGVGLLIWYYSGILSHRNAGSVSRQKPMPAVVSDVALPPLGPIRDPRAALAVTDSGPASASLSSAPVMLPSEPPAVPPTPLAAAAVPLAPTTAGEQATAAAISTRQTALERRLAGPAFAAGSAELSTPSGASTGPLADVVDHSAALAGLLVPTATPAARANDLPTQRLLLAKGAFIDCTLETAIDSSLPGMTTCITATDTFGVDGKVVLLERGSKLIGETRGQVQQGSARLFVLWTEARTPTGVVVPLASPGTDALGRSGLDGEVDRHFWERFGAAILISLVDGAAQAAQRSGGSGTFIYDSSSSRDVATEALRSSLGIAPTITKHQGDRIQILVARDLDFRPVYQLRDAGMPHQQ
ncbi:MAG: type IV secretion system protein VirB10 [Steroidobacteraceae bacterium]